MSKPRSILFWLIAVLLPAAFFTSCRMHDKIDSTPGRALAFSTDTVFFDTVFPSVGSITQRLIVYNRNTSKVKVSSIRLAGGSTSNYSLNINGTAAASVSNVEIPGKDSLFIFVRVTVDPQNLSTPFVVSDSIQFLTNGTSQQVKLVAWGRDAIFYREKSLSGNITWDSLKAHVIYGSLRIDTNSTLTVMPGARIYFHKDASMYLSYGSTLKIPGTRDHPVRFQGDRLDPYYKDLPGQWGGIYLEKGSRDHVINYAVIRNGYFGLALDSTGTSGAPMLDISNTIIRNMAGYGIYAWGSAIRSVNCVIGDCGQRCLDLTYGGDYEFKHLTVGNYWSASVRNGPSIALSNYGYDTLGNKVANPLVRADFINTIIYGVNDGEIGLDSVAGTPFECLFDHAILKTRLSTTNPQRYINCLVNKDPLFVDPSVLNYSIDTLSPAIGAGKEAGIPFDINGNQRGNPPALGAYEFVPGR